ncbi:hypothetical protein L208DRAFT_1395041 [Tricholoma matsutake]|nr:hypothetical protein L208DRAFT_1395041 [Tricholoma matsutake 945]
MSAKNASSNGVPSSLVAFPSVSSSLHSLPHATSMNNVSLHSNMYARRAAESEAKLQKALSKTASQNSSETPAYIIPPLPPSQCSSPLMMRPKTKS